MARGSPTRAAEALAAVPLFQSLTPRELETVAELAKEFSFGAGQPVTKEGADAGRMFVIVEGTAKVDVHGKEVASLGPGDVIGEMALIDGRPRTATVTAETAVKTLSIAAFNFRPLLREHPALAEKLMIELSLRLREVQGSPLA